MSDINVVALSGRLTREPEVRTTASGFAITALSLAVNDRRKVDGEWTDVPGFFDAKILGERGPKLAAYLTKGKPVTVSGKLEWRQYEARDGSKRTAVSVLVNDISFPNLVSEQSEQSRDRAVAELGATDVTDEEVPF